MPDLERNREYIISDSIDIQVKIELVEFDDMAWRATSPKPSATAPLTAPPPSEYPSKTKPLL